MNSKSTKSLNKIEMNVEIERRLKTDNSNKEALKTSL